MTTKLTTKPLSRIHVTIPTLAETRIIVGCIWRVLLDSNRTADISLADELSAQAQLPYLIQCGVFEGPDGEALLRDRPEFADVDLDALAALPPSTLGGALARFLKESHLSDAIYTFPVTYTTDPVCAYLMRRIFDVHDVWHVLTNFTTAGHDEILLQAFSLAQTGLPSSAALLLFGSVKHMVLEARWNCLRRGMADAYARGLAAAPLMPVYWEKYFADPLDEVRARYGVRPWTDDDHAGSAPWVWRPVNRSEHTRRSPRR